VQVAQFVHGSMDDEQSCVDATFVSLPDLIFVVYNPVHLSLNIVWWLIILMMAFMVSE